jgi:exo-1,4-beta-D-glucosaminidase
MNLKPCWLVVVWAVGSVLCIAVSIEAQSPQDQIKVSLQQGWLVRSSAGLGVGGAAISTPGFSPDGWLKTSIPATPLGAQVENGVLPSPYEGTNSRNIPGWSYPIGDNYSDKARVRGSPYAVDWWFLNQFTIPSNLARQRIFLHFDAINYRATLWVNGRLIADKSRMVGAYTIFEFDITNVARVGQANAVALDLAGPASGDLSITFLDWSPMPGDRDMGIWRGAWITSNGPVQLRFPQAQTHLDSTLTSAALTVSAELSGTKGLPVSGTLSGTITPGDITFSQHVILTGRNRKYLARFSSRSFPQLNIANPALWWPAQLGPQNLYTCHLRFLLRGTVSDEVTFRFGVRKIESGLNDEDPDTGEQYRWFRINNQTIMIKAAGWSYDMLLKYSTARWRQEMQYIRDLNLNGIRLEGTMENQSFYDLADEYGIMIMAGWACGNQWESWKTWSPENFRVAMASLDSQMRALRNHPSVFLWMNASDLQPPRRIERRQYIIERADRWPNPVISNADYSPSQVTGISGVKMKGPYQWEPPIFWYSNRDNGGAFGFATEISIGPEVPPMETLTSEFQKDPVPWPIDSNWTLHMGGAEFSQLDIVTDALNRRYGQATSAADYVRKSQVQNYECTRAMFEAYEANKNKTDGTASTGLVQWQLNKAWPSLHWQLYDWYLRPGGAYFGAKKGAELLHIQWDYGFQNEVRVINDYYQNQTGLVADAQVFDFDLTLRYHNSVVLDASPDSSNVALRIPKLPNLSKTYFVKLQLKDSAGRVLSDNFYWYSAVPDQVPVECEWQCLAAQFADLRALQTLGLLTVRHLDNLGSDSATVTLTNDSRGLAFLIRVRITNNEKEVLPVLWTDNYVSLLPGESRTVKASFEPGALPAGAVVQVDGFNVNPN